MIANRTIHCVIAYAENRAFGKDQGLPWDCPEDLQHFRDTTRGHTLIVGRKTLQALPAQALQNRHVIVLSRTMSHDSTDAYKQNNIVFVPSLEALPAAVQAAPSEKAISAIGGANVVSQLFMRDMIDDLTLSKIKGCYDADCFLPEAFLQAARHWSVTRTDKRDAFTIQYLKNPLLQVA